MENFFRVKDSKVARGAYTGKKIHAKENVFDGTVEDITDNGILLKKLARGHFRRGYF